MGASRLAARWIVALPAAIGVWLLMFWFAYTFILDDWATDNLLSRWIYMPLGTLFGSVLGAAVGMFTFLTIVPAFRKEAAYTLAGIITLAAVVLLAIGTAAHFLEPDTDFAALLRLWIFCIVSVGTTFTCARFADDPEFRPASGRPQSNADIPDDDDIDDEILDEDDGSGPWPHSAPSPAFMRRLDEVEREATVRLRDRQRKGG